MKTRQGLSNRKVTLVTIDPELEKYRGKILFPEKLRKANEMLKTAKLPPNKHRS